MIWFLGALGLLILCIVIYCICEHCGMWDSCLEPISFFVGIIAAIIFTIMAWIAIDSNVDVDAYVASMEQRYNILVYQLENDVYDNDNDVGKQELYDQVRRWNEDLARNRELQDSKWVGIFYPNVYDQFEFIPLENDT